ncbi:recombinase RecT [Sphingobacterium multivorum]|uniref:recombinase RecT n=1 Tax=Sphingobacterium multivorum TaxID=28454 RepID=UPI0028AAE65B|nr:recombinase RecT [Sphingobacterium multivorum]
MSNNQLANENQQQQQAQVPQTQNNSAVKKFTEATVEKVLQRVAEIQATGDLVLPVNYIPENAVRSAWLNLIEVKDRNDRPALDVCTPASISNAFLDMVTQGLSISKGQGAFIVYGNQLQFDRSYIGDIAIAKRTANVKEVNAVTVYQDDEFVYEIDSNSGRKKVLKHDQKLANIAMDKIVGAYAVVSYNDGSFDTEIMTMAQIRTAWAMGGSKGNSKAHNNFPDQMAEKTVIGRALKIEAGSSDDSTLLQGRQTDKVSADVKQEIKEKAHTKIADFEDAVVVDTDTGEINTPAAVNVSSEECPI